MSTNIEDEIERQDTAAPEPTPVDIKRGQRKVMGVSFVALVYAGIAILVYVSR